MEKISVNLYKIDDVKVLVTIPGDQEDESYRYFYAKKGTDGDFEFQFGLSMATAMEFLKIADMDKAIEQMIINNYGSGNFHFRNYD